MTNITKTELYQKLVKSDFDKLNLFSFDWSNCSADSTGASSEFRRFSSRITVASNHLRFNRVPTYHPKPDQIARRGAITTFSRHSRLRLRDSLASACLSSAKVYGITLTLPWQTGCLPLSDLLADYKACFNRFGVAFRRAFPNSACIFRHELQTRKMPHCHLVCFFHQSDLRGNLHSDVFNMWFGALKGNLRGGSLLAFARHGVKVDLLADRVAMFRYVSDHSSKSKQAQLGYKGRQWGILNKSLLSPRLTFDYTFRFQADLYFFQRHISKACRFFVKSDCVFGRKLSFKTNGVSVLFVRHKTVKKIIDYINSLSSDSDLPRVLRHKTDIKKSPFLPLTS